MLRVRPLHFTSRPEEFTALLTVLGLVCVQDHGDWRVFDSGNGKVGLHRVPAGSAEDGTTSLGFEIRDREIFVRRTLEDGTHAELVDSRHGPTARVSAPDGTTFLADPVQDLSPMEPGPLTVLQLWHTTDRDGARKVLADIGARPVTDTPGGRSQFRAKNGGLTATHPAGRNGVELCFGYDGELATLGARLTAAGVRSEQPDGHTLTVQSPEGTALRILRSPVLQQLPKHQRQGSWGRTDT